MPFKQKNRVLASALLLLLLAGCAGAPVRPAVPDEEPEEPAAETVEPEPAVMQNDGYTKADSLFSINYSPDASMNPLYSVNTYNEQVFGLLYEGLFRLGEGFTPEPVLCADYSTEDGVTYYFHLKEGVKFHDGSPLTAADVEYTINRAAAGNKYKPRLSAVRAVNAVDDTTLSVVLFSENYQFPALLDIPVIKSGSSDSEVPQGTGPYYYLKVGSTALLGRFNDYRDADKLPIDKIYLRDIAAGEVARAFSGKVLDILSFDPIGTQPLNIHMDYETRYCDTTSLIYLGFNTNRGGSAVAAVRLAISALVNRDALCADILGPSVTPAPLILPPFLGCYDSAWEDGTGYSRSRFNELADEAGIEDYSGDGFWDDAFGVPDLSLSIIVNNDNEYKLAVAREITAELMANGFRVELNELSYEHYIENLKAGTYNLYIGEARLMPDFDLTPMLTRGGSLNYGGITDETCGELARAFLATQGEEHTEAAGELCEYIRDKAFIVPIGYKKTAVITHLGVVKGMAPSYSGIFAGITDWTITLT